MRMDFGLFLRISRCFTSLRDLTSVCDSDENVQWSHGIMCAALSLFFVSPVENAIF